MVEVHKQHYPRSLSKNLSFQVGSSLQLCQEVKHLDLRQEHQDPSAIQSTGESHHEVTRMEGAKSQDQCNSSESVQDGSYEKNVESLAKSVFLMGHPDFFASPSQIDFNQSNNCIPYPYADPYGGGLFTAYGPPAIIQPQMVGVARPRVALPLDFAEDGPIYVNAKQYHGILRRRQTRAKLEAQKKLVKSRKPYLHESRHLHALNRVRGSGGRFLSTKNLQQPDLNTATNSQCVPRPIRKFQGGELEFQASETGKCTQSVPPGCGSHSSTGSNFIFQQPELRPSVVSSRLSVAMQSSGNMMHGGNHHSAPVVR